jgi:hypothetical protein
VTEIHTVIWAMSLCCRIMAGNLQVTENTDSIFSRNVHFSKLHERKSYTTQSAKLMVLLLLQESICSQVYWANGSVTVTLCASILSRWFWCCCKRHSISQYTDRMVLLLLHKSPYTQVYWPKGSDAAARVTLCASILCGWFCCCCMSHSVRKCTEQMVL